MGAAPPFLGEEARRRRGPRGGIARGERREPVGGFGARGGARRWQVRGGRHPAVVGVSGDDAPVKDWRGKRVGEPRGTK